MPLPDWRRRAYTPQAHQLAWAPRTRARSRELRPDYGRRATHPRFPTYDLPSTIPGGSMRVIDLRSDTVTLPSPEMRRFIYEAELGDDVYGEDPTINRLQARAAEMLGKEASLYVPSGTMGNVVAHLTWCQAGDEVICGQAAHTLNAEAA